jgi:plasmid maintenance system killer protein
MIRSYGDNRTGRFARGERIRQFEVFRRQAEKTVDRLDATVVLGDIARFLLQQCGGREKGYL